MKYAHYKADGTCEFIMTENPIKLEKLKELVGGNIDGYQTQNGELIYINDEGRLYNLPSNPFYFEDVRGDVVEYMKVDENGESIGFDDDAVLRSVSILPEDLFEKGNKYTILWISDSWGSTVFAEIVTAGRSWSGDFKKPIFKLKGKRKEVAWNSPNSEVMIFRGHNIPLKDSLDIKNEKGGMTQRVLRMNGMYNLCGLKIDNMREFIKEEQINPFFIRYDRIMHISDDGKTEILVFPEAPASSQKIADMQSAQLKDSVSRIVIA